MSGAIHKGSCACGKVTIEAKGEPLRVGLCHCLTCRKVHAAPFNAFATFTTVAVRIKGDDLGEFASSERGRRYFCRQCGGLIYSQYDRDDEIELYLGSFDDTSLWNPTFELWTMRCEAWMAPVSTVRKRFERDPPPRN
jgi:hypothetical protein